MAAINSRLKVGTTPVNPVLTSQWNTAQTQLDALSRDIALMKSLANRVASDSATTSYLLETTRATYGLSGAVDEDHRQLAILEDEVNRTVVLVDRLLNELSEDINRQSGYVGRERKNLTTLSVAVKNGELMGASLANRTYGTAPFPARVHPPCRAPRQPARQQSGLFPGEAEAAFQARPRGKGEDGTVFAGIDAKGDAPRPPVAPRTDQNGAAVDF